MKTNVDKFMMLDNNFIVRIMNNDFNANRKWTCVKFADGHIEWVATSRLKKNIHTRGIEFIMGMGLSWNAAANWYTFAFFFGTALSVFAVSMLIYMLYNMFFVL